MSELFMFEENLSLLLCCSLWCYECINLALSVTRILLSQTEWTEIFNWLMLTTIIVKWVLKTMNENPVHSILIRYIKDESEFLPHSMLLSCTVPKQSASAQWIALRGSSSSLRQDSSRNCLGDNLSHHHSQSENFALKAELSLQAIYC